MLVTQMHGSTASRAFCSRLRLAAAAARARVGRSHASPRWLSNVRRVTSSRSRSRGPSASSPAAAADSTVRSTAPGQSPATYASSVIVNGVSDAAIAASTGRPNGPGSSHRARTMATSASVNSPPRRHDWTHAAATAGWPPVSRTPLGRPSSLSASSASGPSSRCTCDARSRARSANGPVAMTVHPDAPPVLVSASMIVAEASSAKWTSSTKTTTGAEVAMRSTSLSNSSVGSRGASAAIGGPAAQLSTSASRVAARSGNGRSMGRQLRRIVRAGKVRRASSSRRALLPEPRGPSTAIEALRPAAA